MIGYITSPLILRDDSSQHCGRCENWKIINEISDKFTCHSPGGPGGSRIGGARMLGGRPGGGPGGIPGGLPGGGPGGNMRGSPPMGAPRSGGGRNIIGGRPGGGPERSIIFVVTTKTVYSLYK